MQKRKLLSIMTLFFLFLFINLAFSQPVQFSSSPDKSLEVSYLKFESLPVNQDFNMSIHLYNSSDTLEVNNADCKFELYNHFGIHVIDDGILTNTGNDYFYFIPAINLSEKGFYSYNIYCNVSDVGGFADGIFQVTDYGEMISTPRALSYLGALFYATSLLFFFMFLYVTIPPIKNEDKELVKKYRKNKNAGMFVVGLNLLKEHLHRALFLFIYLTLILMSYIGYGFTLEFNMEVASIIFNIVSTLLTILLFPYMVYITMMTVEMVIRNLFRIIKIGNYGGDVDYGKS